MKLLKILGPNIVIVIFLSGCTVNPVGAFKLSESNLKLRDIQSRVYQDVDEVALMSASAALFQDMGYNIVEAETKLGLITATKMIDATNAAEVIAALIVAILGDPNTAIDDKQEFTVTVVVLPRGNSNTFSIRMTMQQVIWNTHGQVSDMGIVQSEEVYNIFFDKLSKSVFLETNI